MEQGQSSVISDQSSIEEVKPIDESKLPIEKVNELLKKPEEERAAILKGEKETPSAASAATSPLKQGEENKTVETPEAKASREASEALVGKGKEQPEKLFAGKYKTKEELVKGFVSTSAALNYNPKMLEKMAALALKTGDIETIEELYLELEKAIASNNKATAPSEQQPPVKPKPGTSEESERDTSTLPTTMDAAVTQEAARLTLQGALSELHGTRLIARMEKQGIVLPEGFIVDKAATTEFLTTIEKEAPWFFDQLEREWDGLVKKHSQEIKSVLIAMEEAKAENPKRQADEIAKIKAEAAEIKLPVKDEELTAFVTEALKQPWVYEEKNGIQFVRPGAIADAWYLANRANIHKQLQINAEINGRTQAVDDISGNRKKANGSISSAILPGDQAARRNTTKSLDLEDETVQSSLSLDEINDLLKHPEKRAALQPR
jgi:hypothetical protein